MGTYAYILRSPTLARQVRIERPDGSTFDTTVASIGFTHKISWSLPEPRWIAPLVARMKAAWGDSRPSFGAVTSHLDDNLEELSASRRFRIEVGQTVYRWIDRPVPFALTDGSGGIGSGVPVGRIRAVLWSGGVRPNVSTAA